MLGVAPHASLSGKPLNTVALCAGSKRQRCAICHTEPGPETAPAEAFRFQVEHLDVGAATKVAGCKSLWQPVQLAGDYAF